MLKNAFDGKVSQLSGVEARGAMFAGLHFLFNCDGVKAHPGETR
jgi:hypothetical protein